MSLQYVTNNKLTNYTRSIAEHLALLITCSAPIKHAETWAENNETTVWVDFIQRCHLT